MWTKRLFKVCIISEKNMNEGNRSIQLFKRNNSIERKQIRVTNLNRGKHINFKRKTTKQQNTEVQKNDNIHRN